jgi:ABC-2 type transport system permease protein
MTLTLVRKLLRDVRLPLLLVCLLVLLFQLLWARITHRIVGEIAPYFAYLTGGPEGIREFLNVVFSGPGKIVQTIIGGETIELDNTMHVLSIGYVHPLMQFIFCIWAVGRASGAIAGEIDRGTMELILSQPLPRSRLLLAHFLVDLMTIPLICLSLWAGNWLGYWLLGPIEVKEPPAEVRQMAAFNPLNPLAGPKEPPKPDPAKLQIRPIAFAPALGAVAALMFGVAGFTMALSARGRFRWRVLGTAVFLFLVMFLLNLIGQMWEEAFGWARPLTVFYYYQPQQLILHQGGTGPILRVLVLVLVGLVGYALALRTFTRRDLPAPL